MMRYSLAPWLTPLLVAVSIAPASGRSGPFDGESFRGRIAYSADGNYNDEDDWAASAVALAIFAECGVKDRLVHFDFNCILPKTDPEWERQHATSVLGAAERYGYPASVFHDCQKDREGAIASIVKAINQSSTDDPLYFILAGPMEVPYLGIQASDPDKRAFVYCISHSRWNDGYSSADLVEHNKRHVIPLGITWVQIADQNRFLSTSPYGRPANEDEWRPWHWMRDSDDPNVRFLWDRMQATTRADCSDAGMAYFLVTGDEEPEIAKVRALLDGNRVPAPLAPRKRVRLEAENFRTLHNYEVEYRDDRQASQRINLKLAGVGDGRVCTAFDEPYTPGSARYDVDVRYLDEAGGQCAFALYVNGTQRGAVWRASGDDGRWRTQTIRGLTINTGDEITVEARGDGAEQGRLDHVQLNLTDPRPSASPLTATGPFDDPDALPGQVIVAGDPPGYLKYNGGGPVFLCGPDNPETFLFLGDLNPDGTRSNGEQQLVIDRLVESGANAFHCQMFRMRRCNIKDEGDDQHCPFVDFDPSQALNDAILDQWDGWVSQLEEAGIVVHLEFYNDATDVELMGWTLDEDGNLHPDEKRMFEGIVTRLKHHKNIIWGIEESLNKLPRARTPHFMKLSELIAGADNHHHPIVHSFVTPDTSEGDLHEDKVMSDEYVGDPNIRLVTWLHVLPHGDDYEAQHQAYLQYAKTDSDRFIVMKNETERFPRTEPQSRIYMWSCAMTGMHALEAGHDVLRRQNLLAADGHLARFMEQTVFHTMEPRDDLAAGSARWVLADPGQSYIAYTYDYTGPMGIRNMTAGTYDLMWFDAIDGDAAVQAGLLVGSGDVTWAKPDSVGSEVALYIVRSAGAN